MRADALDAQHHAIGIFRFVVGLPTIEYVQDGKSMTGAEVDHLTQQVAAGNIGDGQFAAACAEPADERGIGLDPNEMGQRDASRQRGEAGAAGHADRGYQPDCRRGGESARDILTNEDQSAADKADSGNDLRGHTRRIEHDAASQRHIAESVF